MFFETKKEFVFDKWLTINDILVLFLYRFEIWLMFEDVVNILKVILEIKSFKKFSWNEVQTLKVLHSLNGIVKQIGHSIVRSNYTKNSR